MLLFERFPMNFRWLNNSYREETALASEQILLKFRMKWVIFLFDVTFTECWLCPFVTFGWLSHLLLLFKLLFSLPICFCIIYMTSVHKPVQRIIIYWLFGQILQTNPSSMQCSEMNVMRSKLLSFFVMLKLLDESKIWFERFTRPNKSNLKQINNHK